MKKQDNYWLDSCHHSNCKSLENNNLIKREESAYARKQSSDTDNLSENQVGCPGEWREAANSAEAPQVFFYISPNDF